MAEKGSITFSTALDNTQLEKDYQDAVKKIEKLEKELNKETDTRGALEKKMEDAGSAAEETKRRLEELRLEQEKLNQQSGAGGMKAEEAIAIRERQQEITGQITEQQKQLMYQEALRKKLEEMATKHKAAETAITTELGAQKERAVQIEAEMAKMAEAANTSGVQQRFIQMFKGIQTAAGKFTKRLKSMFARVFMFSVIMKGLRELRELLGNAIAGNDEAAQSLARLKGAFLTMIQPIIDFIIPIATKLMDVLTRVMVVVGHFVSMLFGQSYAQSKKNAAALQGQADGIEAVGDAAKDANGYLAGFDELNKMDDNTGSNTAPSFDFSDDFMEGSEAAEKYGDDLARVGAGALAVFDGIKQAIKGFLDGDVDAAFDGLHTIVDGLGEMMHGVADLFFDFLDDITGGRFSDFINQIREYFHNWIDGLVEFGHGALDVIKGIVTGDIDLIMQGLNGMFSGLAHMWEASVNICLTIIEGLINGFLDWLDKLTGGRFHAFFEALKTMFHNNVELVRKTVHEVVEDAIKAFKGLTEFIIGVFTGDWDRAWNGLKESGKATLNGMLALVEGFLGLVANGVNTVTGLLNQIQIDIPEWVPKYGGGKFGFNIPEIPAPKLPRLASGAVIPPNREFAAVLGDQQSGYNIETPEDLLRSIVREESGNSEMLAMLGSILQAVRDGHNLYVDKRILGRVASEQMGNMARMGGAY